MTSTPSILLISGKGRSGSTLLDNVLDAVPGVFSAGELFHLWDWGLQAGHLCGCARPVPSCDIWSQVIATVGKERARAAADVQAKHLSWRALPRALAGRPAEPAYVELLADTYRAIGDVTGARVIVDASKIPWHPTVLNQIPGLDVRVVHLVRDPRAVAWSWTRAKPMRDSGPGETMPTWSTSSSAASWLARNLAAEAARRRHPPDRWLRVRYEDLVAEPRATLRHILTFAGLDPDALPMTGDRTIELGPNHTVGGNPDRQARTTVEIRPDDEWRRAQHPRDRRIATALAGPLLRRYGYAWRAPPDG